MKNVKIVLMTFALAIGIGGAFSFTPKAKKGDLYFAYYSGEDHWSWSTTTNPSFSCEVVPGKYCSKIAETQPDDDEPGDDFGKKYQ